MVMTTYADFRFYGSTLIFSRHLLYIPPASDGCKETPKESLFKEMNDHTAYVMCLTFICWPKNLYIT